MNKVQQALATHSSAIVDSGLNLNVVSNVLNVLDNNHEYIYSTEEMSYTFNLIGVGILNGKLVGILSERGYLVHEITTRGNTPVLLAESALALIPDRGAISTGWSNERHANDWTNITGGLVIFVKEDETIESCLAKIEGK